MDMMRAAMYDRYGPPEVLYFADLPIPEVPADQVLVRVEASSVNGGELSAREGKIRLLTGRRFPKLVGIDLVGSVERVGAEVSSVKVGDRVWGLVDESVFGATAEFALVRPEKLAPAPTTLEPVEAVTLLAGGTTSITALRDHAHLGPGERLLVRGASGGVGSLAVQIGKLFGAHVTGLAGAKNLDFVRSLGADEVHDYRTTTPADLGRFDVVLDTAGTDHRTYRGLLAPGGRMVAVSLDFDHLPGSIAYLAGSAVHGAQRVRFFRGDPHSDLVAELTRHADSGDVRPVVDTVHPLENIATAHRALEAGGVRGKHVVRIS
ncbi:NAD(P)-dependent alcohol dehydrogenase [Brachybacterium sacelli]|uniref:NADPH:quinone reductase-like Zn-dependent oxidoreductase n=1 Tax=Brachybacterium sacelli TaxID=173364 RepID=A0ABS4WYE0_9MICO|nr:NAD(P)-dependent alcohol dehydrogenase [Brachybacterium sacelli]MBP2381210.1 NADPH:quinone reductase-like Zn-dependent oxidoreductase [Brachybacterium sacelli]